MRMYTAVLISVAAVMIVAACAPTTFIVSKDGRAYYLGTTSKVSYEMLCRSGDLRRVLSETSIPGDLREDLYRYNCGEERSKEKVVATYVFLSPEEKEELKSAFARHGYTVNYVPC